MRQIMLVGHVTFLTEVVILTFGTVPSNADDSGTTAYVTRHEYMPRSLSTTTLLFNVLTWKLLLATELQPKS